MRLVMQSALAIHKLHKQEGGKDDFLYFLLDVCTQLIQHSPRFRDQEDYLQIALLGLQDKVTGQQREIPHKSDKACSQEQNGADFAM